MNRNRYRNAAGLLVLPVIAAVLMIRVSQALANSRARALVVRAQERAGRVRCFSEDFKLVMAGDDIVGPVVGHIVWKAPNLYRLEMWPLDESGKQIMDEAKPHRVNIEDGHAHYFIDSDGSETKSPADQPINQLDSLLVLSIIMPENDSDDGPGNDFNNDLPPSSKLTLRTVKWQGANYNVVSFRDTDKVDEEIHKSETMLYIGQDGLIHRELDTDNGNIILDTSISNVQIDPPLTRSEFAFTYPPAAKLWRGEMADERTPIDAKSKELLQAAMFKIQSLNGVSAEFSMTRDDLEPHQADVRETTIVSIKLLRPRYAFIRRDIHTVRGGNPQGSRSALIDFDGKFRWIQQVGGPYPSIDHMRVPGADTDEELHLHDITPLRGFFDSSWAIFYFREGLSEMHYAGKETWRGSVYDVVAGSRPPYKANDPHEIGPAGENVRIYIGEDNLIHRVVRKLDSEGTTTEEEDLDHVALNPKLTGEDFTFKPLPALANPEAPARATPGNAGGL